MPVTLKGPRQYSDNFIDGLVVLMNLAKTNTKSPTSILEGSGFASICIGLTMYLGVC